MPKRPLRDPVTRAARGSAIAGRVSVLATKEFAAYMNGHGKIQSVPFGLPPRRMRDLPTYLAIFFVVVVHNMLVSLCVYDIGCESHGERHLGYADKPVCYSTGLYSDHSLDMVTMSH